MRLRSALGLLLTALVVLATGGPTSLAQYTPGPYQAGPLYRSPPPPADSRRYERIAPRYEAPRPAPAYRAYQPAPEPYRTQPQSRTRYQPAPERPSGFFFPWASPEPAYQEPVRPQRRRERPEEVRRRAPRVVPAKPAEPEVEPSIFVAVFGDTYGEHLARGLDDVLEENLDIEIVRKIRGDAGLVRVDNHDLAKTAQEFVNSGQKITYAVVMLGANDRQAIREGETSHDPLSDRWREIYRDRVDALIKPFVERRIPLLWVGLPPLRNERAAAEAVALNDIYRERVQRAGGVYVEIWEAFVDDQNRYAVTGPDVDGQVTRLRSSDGIHFTRAGARKVAHFADVQLKRLIDAKGPGTSVAAAPAAPGVDGSSVERLINASVPALPELQGLPTLAARPLAGPVLPLTRVDVSPGGTLASGVPRPNPDTAHVIERALREGLPPAPKTGRADDFAWPKQ